MRWFQGGISEAIAEAKTTQSIFVVFIEGDDDASKGSANVLNNQDISEKLAKGFVSIKLDSQSEAYKQFSQIYQFVPIPSLFFISPSGTPLEVVVGEMETEELKSKIDKIQLNFKNDATKEDQSSPSTLNNPNENPSQSVGTASSITPNTTQNVDTPSSSTMNEPLQNQDANSSDNDALSKDDKMERAKQLIEIKKQIKQDEEEKTQRQKELERRVVGQEVQKLRRRQQELEMKQAREEWQKEKAEAAAAREKILKQIEQDKSDRLKKVEDQKKALQKNTNSEENIVPPRNVVKPNCDISRLQFRLPDGISKTHQFPATTTLGEVRQWVQSEIPMPFPDFALSTFPRREYTRDEDGQTLRDLSLIPNAVILILPSSLGSSRTKRVTPADPSYGNFLTRFFWNLLTPLITIFDYVRGMFGGRRGGTNNENQNPQPSDSSNQPIPRRPRQDDSIVDDMKARRRLMPGESRIIRRQGNIHGLSNARDSSDDENNTWNGNSTQQM